MAEVLEALFGEAAFEEGARVDAGRSVALEVYDIAGLVAIGGVEEMIESDLEQGSQGGIGGNMAADAGVVLVLVHHHGHGIPADQALDAALHGAVAWIGDLIFGTNGIDVRRVPQARRFDARDFSVAGQLLQDVCGSVRAGFVDHLVQRFHPLRGFLWIRIFYSPLIQFLVHGSSHYTVSGRVCGRVRALYGRGVQC